MRFCAWVDNIFIFFWASYFILFQEPFNVQESFSSETESSGRPICNNHVKILSYPDLGSAYIMCWPPSHWVLATSGKPWGVEVDIPAEGSKFPQCEKLYKVSKIGHVTKQM